MQSLGSSNRSNNYDVIVIGGGIIGSCTAYAAAASKQRVLCLEQFAFLHRRGSSHGDSRIIRRTYPEDFYAQMMREAFTRWDNAEHESNTKVISTTGSLDFGEIGNEELEGLKAACHKHDIEHTVLTPKEVEERFPGVKLPAHFEAVYSGEGGVINATKACAMWQDLARRRGATLQDETEVVSINEMEDGVEVVTRSQRKFKAPKVVVCPGAWASKLLKKTLGLNVRTRVLKTSVCYWRSAEPSFRADGGFPVFINYANKPGDSDDIYGLPMLEYPGLLKVCLHDGPVVDPDTRDFHVDPDGTRKVSKWLRKILPSCAATPEHAETCMYTMTHDHHFIMDLAPGSRRIVIGAGFSGHGFKMAPLIGSLLADIAAEGRVETVTETRNIDLSHFNIERVLGDTPSKL